jgi:ATP-dependent DNA helicase RecG
MPVTSSNFDQQPVLNVSMADDLDMKEVEDHLNHAKRVNRYQGHTLSVEEMLIEQRAVVKVDGKLVPTVAGLLFFGRWPQRHLPHATVSLVHYRGNNVNSADVIHFQEYTGTIRQQIDLVVAYLTGAMKYGYKLIQGKPQRTEYPQYPVVALRELTINALAHRDYEVETSAIRISMFANRIEWTNPGELMEGVTIETIRDQQKARNRTLLQFLFQRSYVERIGQGLDTVFDECAKAALPEPIMRQAHGNFTVSLTGHDLVGGNAALPGLKEHQIAIINILQQEDQPLTLPEVVDRVNDVLPKGRSKRSVQEDMRVLVQAGIVERIGDSVASAYALNRVPK